MLIILVSQKPPCWRANCPLGHPKQSILTQYYFVLDVPVGSLGSVQNMDPPFWSPIWSPFGPPSGPPFGPPFWTRFWTPIWTPFLLGKCHFLIVDGTLNVTPSTVLPFVLESFMTMSAAPQVRKVTHQVICFCGNGPYLPYSWIISALSKA